jgi:hypothetical protein
VPTLLGVLAVVVVAAAAVGGWQVAGEESSEGPAPERSRVSNGDLAVSHGGAWREEGPAAVPGLAMEDPIALAPRGAAADAGQLTAGFVRARGPCLLPAAFRDRLSRSPRCDDRVRLGRLEAVRHTGLRARGVEGRMSVYAVPTGAGVATVACTGRAVAGNGESCEAAASTLALRDVRSYPVRPIRGYAARVDRAMERLNGRRTPDRARLSSARLPGGQARLARRLSGWYADAHRDLDRVRVSPVDREAHDGLVRALAGTRDAYGGMAAAAVRADAAGWRRARAGVRRGEAAVQRALRGLERLGYRVE